MFIDFYRFLGTKLRVVVTHTYTQLATLRCSVKKDNDKKI